MIWIFKLIIKAFAFLVGVVFPFGLAAVILVVIPIRRMKQRNRCTQVVNAVIADVGKDESYDSEDGKTYVNYYPIYRYEYGGRTFFKSSSNKYLSSPPKGKTVQIRINHQNPEEIYENKGCADVLRSLIMVIVGLVFAAVGVWASVTLAGM